MTHRPPHPALRRTTNVALASLALLLAACAGDGSGEDEGPRRDAGSTPPTTHDASSPVTPDAGPWPGDAGTTGGTDASVASDGGPGGADAAAGCECAPTEEDPSAGCRELASACEGGSEESCALHRSLCGDGRREGDGAPPDGEAEGDPCTCTDAGTASCEDLYALCAGGDAEACHTYATECRVDGDG